MSESPAIYLLFSGWDYYPVGGVDDLVGCYPTLDEAKTARATRLDEPWAQIAELAHGKITRVWDWGEIRHSSNDWTERAGRSSI